LEIVADPQRQIHDAIMESSNIRDNEKGTAQRDYPSTLQGQFRLFMTVGQTFSKQGDLRIGFYDWVVERANEVGFWWYFSAAMLTAMYSYLIRRPKRLQNAKHQRANFVYQVS
jgi:hypothetical protein